MRASGTLETSDLAPTLRLPDRFEATIRFQVDNLLKARSGVFPLSPLLFYLNSINDMTAVDDGKTYRRDFACRHMELHEIFDIALEPGVQLTQLPEPLTPDTPYLAFKCHLATTAPELCVAAFMRASSSCQSTRRVWPITVRAGMPPPAMMTY